MDHRFPARPDQVLINQKKNICQLVDFAVPEDQSGKIKETEKINKHFDLN